MGEAGHVATQAWAGTVERFIGTAYLNEENASAREEPAPILDELYLLEFDRTPNELFEKLGTGVALRSCRQALIDNGHEWRLITGTMVFVHPSQYRYVMQALNKRELKRSQVVIAKSLEHLVEESICNIGKGAWAKKRLPLGLAKPSSSVAVEPGSDDADHVGLNLMLFEQEVHWSEWPDLISRRTFICSAPRLLCSTTVYHSTTETNARNGDNPRRAAVHDDETP